MTTMIEQELVLTAAKVEIAAGQREGGVKQPTVNIVAYTGGVMRVGGWGNIAINLAGLDCGGLIPLLVDHDTGLDNVLGKGEAAVQAGQLRVAGSIVGSTASARKVLDLARDGFPLQASVGVAPDETVRLAPGEKMEINGRTVVAPKGGLTVVTKGTLREVSVVTLGCDGRTSVAIAASRGVVDDDDVLAAERVRVAGIMKLTARHPEIAAKAVSNGWDAARTELEVLRTSRPTAPMAGGYRPAATTEVIEAALAFRMGMSKTAEKHFKSDVLQQAHDLGITHCLDLCRMALTLDGQEIPVGRDAMVKAALSTMSLPVALGDLASKNLLDAYSDAPATWRSFAAIRSVADFKTNTAIRPSFVGGLEQVAPGGELKHGTVKEWLASYQIDTYGKLLGIDRRDLINDDLGVFAEASAAMGKAAMRKLNDLVFGVLLANEGNFFSKANSNYIDGADSNLSTWSLSNAIKAMISQRDDEGNDLDIRPAVLLVPPALETTARSLLESEYIMAQVDLPTGNSLRNVVKLEVEPRLANAQKFGKQTSNAHWYLFASPAATAMVVAFLNGQQSPTIEFQGIEHDVNTLAAHWRVYHDFGAAMIDPRAAVRSKGIA
ncbi:MAG: Mu-like prophage major head subunit gpT family protein [Phycisphaerales bacterium]|nr:Mu-like prophage major head subunit gpT family protein [Phycisphaerales bacterium]